MTLAEIIQTIAKTNDAIYSVVGVVDSVDKNKRTCDVKPTENKEAILYDVRLQATPEGSNGKVYFPAVGSVVVVTFLNKNTGYVALFSEVDSVEMVVGSQKMDFDKDGLLLESPQGSLLSAWTDLLNILQEFKLSTNSGMTIAVSPDIILKIKSLKQKVNSFLK